MGTVDVATYTRSAARLFPDRTKDPLSEAFGLALTITLSVLTRNSYPRTFFSKNTFSTTRMQLEANSRKSMHAHAIDVPTESRTTLWRRSRTLGVGCILSQCPRIPPHLVFFIFLHTENICTLCTFCCKTCCLLLCSALGFSAKTRQLLYMNIPKVPTTYPLILQR